MCGIDVAKTKIIIKMLRIESGHDMNFLEKYFGLSHQALYKWEQLSNATLPSLDNLVALSELYDVSLDDIIIRRVSKEVAA